jgi:hypothetical protein
MQLLQCILFAWQCTHTDAIDQFDDEINPSFGDHMLRFKYTMPQVMCAQDKHGVLSFGTRSHDGLRGAITQHTVQFRTLILSRIADRK